MWQDIESTKRPSKAAQYTGWEASSTSISEALQREQPVDGILGEPSMQLDCCHVSDREANLSTAEYPVKMFGVTDANDVLAGFSQGSVAAALFLAETRKRKQASGLKFAILVSTVCQTIS